MTLQHVQIRKDLYLVQHTHSKAKKTEAVKPPTNHIWLFDRSGSMHWNLPGLIKDLKAIVRTIRSNDTVTLGWFSGPREHNFIIKGFKVTSDADFVALDKLLDKHSDSVGMTCFSEILTSTKQVVEDLKPFSNTFSLMFLTDGYPTVSNYNREVETVLKAVTDLQGEVTTALLVGYGNYYNKALMTDISEKLGAALTHSEGVHEFRTAIDLFLKDALEANKKLKISLDIPYASAQTKYPVAFSVNGTTVNILAQDSDQSVYMTESDNVNDYLYVLSSVKPTNSKEVILTDVDVKSKGTHEPLVRGVYAASYVLCQLAKTDQAMEVLATIGDASLIDSLTNAYTPAEYGAAEKRIVAAVNETSGRYIGGYKKNYLPPVDAFCLLDVLDTLLDDENAHFYPYHEAFNYKRVGVKAETVDDAPEFHAGKDVKVPISSLVWNSSMLNLSVYAKIPGTVKLTAEASKLGFATDYPTWINRNYTVVKDGFLNVKVLPVSMSLNTFNKLNEQGLIDQHTHWMSEDQVVLLHLDRVPVINRAMAEGKTSATQLAEKVKREYEFKGQLKALKWYKDQEIGDATEKVGVFASLNDTQIEYLEKHYIGKNGFSPKTEKGDSIDHYFAKEFDIKVKGLSSFPKVTDVQAKLKAGKNLTVSDTFVKKGIDLFEQSGMANQSKEVKIAWLNGKIGEIQTQQRKVSREIQEAKFAVLLAKKWFDEFSSREENVLTAHDLNFTFALREVQVDI